MSRGSDVRSLIQDQSGRPVLLQTQAFTAAAASVNLATTPAEVAFRGSNIGLETGALLMLQADQDFFVRLRQQNADGTAPTAGTTAANGIFIRSGDMFFVHKLPSDGSIDVIRSTADGTLKVSVVI